MASTFYRHGLPDLKDQLDSSERVAVYLIVNNRQPRKLQNMLANVAILDVVIAVWMDSVVA